MAKRQNEKQYSFTRLPRNISKKVTNCTQRHDKFLLFTEYPGTKVYILMFLYLSYPYLA